jgi:hypothetical protein
MPPPGTRHDADGARECDLGNSFSPPPAPRDSGFNRGHLPGKEYGPIQSLLQAAPRA